jgi:hypothetical protein
MDFGPEHDRSPAHHLDLPNRRLDIPPGELSQ